MASTTIGPIPRAAAGLAHDSGCNSTRAEPAILPSDFPGSVSAPSAWVGSDMTRNKDDFILTLASSDIAEVEAALDYFNGKLAHSRPFPPRGHLLTCFSRTGPRW
jgi:hypothetical protein